MTRSEIEDELRVLIKRALESGVRSEQMHGLIDDAKSCAEAEWLEENRDAIAAHNERICSQGTTLTPTWLGQSDK